MALASRAVTVETTATRLDDSTDTFKVQSISVYNNGAVTVFIGGSGVTTSTGCPVPAGSWSPGIDLRADESLYGVVASGTCDVRVLEAST